MHANLLFLTLGPFSSVGLTKFFVGIAGLTYFLRQQVLIFIMGRRSFQGNVTSFMDILQKSKLMKHFCTVKEVICKVQDEHF
jgi:hypothetical protein